MRGWTSGLGFVLALAAAAPAIAQEMTAQALSDRAEISDILTRYYNNFGNNAEDTVGQFYAPDGEMVLGTTSYKGIEAIKGAYAGVPKDAPQKSAFALNILISNLLVTVHGDAATARLVFTETLTDKQGEAPRILTQGREFDHFVKRDGKWLIARRQIMGANGVPDGWED
ncbi:MAG: nuclear transport factor 2 family protein [Candidatus Andeanibacterium colombiense]|uniref:Nuclear transport factor 2 family protein n=1 Tax=Candidatus Andeanibacterium colombiense TaxID=3121345 RepID=A0AAJ5X3D1_9SPHN|nr:MAG: nuclear transport factor 2 family protein [Sphingomonadaceae bacterium]